MANNDSKKELQTLEQLIEERERRAAIQGLPCVSGSECGSGFGCLGGFCRELEVNNQSGSGLGCGDTGTIDNDDEEYNISIFDPRVPDTWPDPEDAAGCCPGFDIDKKETWPYDPADPTTWPGYTPAGDFVDPADSAGGCTPPDAAVGLPAPPWGDFGYQLAGGCGEPGCGALASYGDDLTKKWTDPLVASNFDPYDPATWPDDQSGINSQDPATWPSEWRDAIPNAQNDFVPGLSEINACGDYICDHLGCRPGKSPGRQSGSFYGTVCCNEQGCYEGECGKTDPDANIRLFQLQCYDGQCVAVRPALENGEPSSFLESNYDLTKNEGWTNATFTVSPDNVFGISELGEIYVLNPDALDFEASETVSVTVEATVDGTAYSQDFSINVLNSNSSPVEFAPDTPIAVDVSESTGPGSLVYKFEATDQDKYTTISYKLLRDGHGRFSIDEQDGELRLEKSLDAEIKEYWLLTVLATSSDGSQALQDLRVNIIDANDNPLIYLDVDYSANFCRINSEPGDSVGITIEAFDLDISVQDAVTYSLISDDQGRFEIHPDTGVVTVKAAFNSDIVNSYPGSVLVETLTPRTGFILIQAVSSDESAAVISKEIAIISVDAPEPTPEVELTPCLPNAYRDQATQDCKCRPGYTYADCDPEDEFDCVLQEAVPPVIDEGTGEVLEPEIPAGTRIPVPGCFRDDDAKDEELPPFYLLPDTSDSPNQSNIRPSEAGDQDYSIVNVNPAWPSILEDCEPSTYTGITVRVKGTGEGVNTEQDWCCTPEDCYTGVCSDSRHEGLCCNEEGSCWAGACENANRPNEFCVTRSGVVEGRCKDLLEEKGESFDPMAYYNSNIRVVPKNGHSGGLEFHNQPTFGPHGGPVYRSYACNEAGCNQSSSGRLNGFCCDDYGCTAGSCGLNGRIEPVCIGSDIQPGLCGEPVSINTFYPMKLYCGPDELGVIDCRRGYANTGEPTFHRERTDAADDDQYVCFKTKRCEHLDLFDLEAFEQKHPNPLTYIQNLFLGWHAPIICDEGGCGIGYSSRFVDYVNLIVPLDNEGQPSWTLPDAPNEAHGWFTSEGFRVYDPQGPTPLAPGGYNAEDVYDICCDKDGCRKGGCFQDRGTVELCCDPDTSICTQGPCIEKECTGFCQAQFEEEGRVDLECRSNGNKLYCESLCQTCDDDFGRCYDRYNPGDKVDAEGQPPCHCMPEEAFPDCWKCWDDGKAALDCNGCQICEEIENFDCGCGGPRVNFRSCVPACVLDGPDSDTNNTKEIQAIKDGNAVEACRGTCENWSRDLGVPTVIPLTESRHPLCGERPGCNTFKYYPGSAATNQTFFVNPVQSGGGKWGIGAPDGSPAGTEANALYYNGVLSYEQADTYQIEVIGQAEEGEARALVTIYIENRDTNLVDWNLEGYSSSGGGDYNRTAYVDEEEGIPNTGVEINNDEALPYPLGAVIQANDPDRWTDVEMEVFSGNFGPSDNAISIDVNPGAQRGVVMVNSPVSSLEVLVARVGVRLQSSDGGFQYCYFNIQTPQPGTGEKDIFTENLNNETPSIMVDGGSFQFTGLKIWATGNYYFAYPESFSIKSASLNGFTINNKGEVSWSGDSSVLTANTVESITVEITMNDGFKQDADFDISIIGFDSGAEAPEPAEDASKPIPQFATWNEDETEWACKENYEISNINGRDVCLAIDRLIDIDEYNSIEDLSYSPSRSLVPFFHFSTNTDGLRVVPVGLDENPKVPESKFRVNPNNWDYLDTIPEPNVKTFTGFFFTMEIEDRQSTVNLQRLPECPSDQICTVETTGEDQLGAFAVRKECPRDNLPEECECDVQCSCHSDCGTCQICEQGNCVFPKTSYGYCCDCERSSAYYHVRIRKQTTPKYTCDGVLIEEGKDEVLWFNPQNEVVPANSPNASPYAVVETPQGIEPLSLQYRQYDALLVHSCDSFGSIEDLELTSVFRVFYQGCAAEDEGATSFETQVTDGPAFSNGFLRDTINYTELYTAELIEYPQPNDPQQPEIVCDEED